MSVKVLSCLVQGIEAKLVEVEIDILPGMPAFSIVGLGDIAVQEAKERIHAAIKNSKAIYPQQKKIINLAPAHIKKNGPHFDLPMALGLLAASNQITIPENSLFIGELALTGEIKPVNGIISMMLFAQKNNFNQVYIPKQNTMEASFVPGLTLYSLNNLEELLQHLRQENLLQPFEQRKKYQQSFEKEANNMFSQVIGQENAKRALQIAAASNHHTLFYGPPGVGKTLLAKALIDILPPLTLEDHMEVIQIYSCAGLLNEKILKSKKRPFRQIHHTASKIALSGGGTIIHPGEISLAHQGILFLDEIAEFPTSHIETLRQPLEEKYIYIARGSGTVKYPTNFTLIAAMNPCPCGFFGDPKKPCHCTPSQILHYRKKISGPIRDRLDLHVHLGRINLKSVKNMKQISIYDIQKKILQARKIQCQRFRKEKFTLNSQMGPAEIKKYCLLQPKVENFLEEASEKLTLSFRAYHQLIKVSRTIADLDEKEYITLEDVSEALQYRSLDMEI